MYRAPLFFTRFYCADFFPSIFPQTMCTKVKGVRKLMEISYVVLSNKFDPRYIRHLRIFYESMAKYTMEKCSALTCFGNKKVLENKKKMRPRAPLNFQKKG